MRSSTLFAITYSIELLLKIFPVAVVRARVLCCFMKNQTGNNSNFDFQLFSGGEVWKVSFRRTINKVSSDGDRIRCIVT